MEAVKLFDEYCIAVCHPDYLIDNTLSTESLQNCVLLQIGSRPSAWYEYFKQQDISVDGTFVGPCFETFYACIAAAMTGYGIALVPERLVAPELEAGTLVQVWEYTSKGRGAYYMAYPLSLGRSHKTKVMVDWVNHYLENLDKVTGNMDAVASI